VKGIGSGALEQGSKFLQQICMRQQFVLDLRVERIKFRFEFGVEKYSPRPKDSMYLKSYVVKYILLRFGLMRPMELPWGIFLY